MVLMTLKRKTWRCPMRSPPCERLPAARYVTAPDDELADVLVVYLTESWKLERTRTRCRDFVAHKLKRGEGQ